jgi:hypothetical protein
VKGRLAMFRAEVRALPLSVCFVAFAALSVSTAMADTPQRCAQAYEKAQEERKAGHLAAAIEYLKKCAAQDCPSFISKDCIRWMTETEAAQPSAVFSVRRNGVDMTTVQIWCDGSILTESLDGKAIAVDPGAHEFVFRVPGVHPIAKEIIIREGERNRIVELDMGGPLPGSAESQSSPIAPSSQTSGSARASAGQLGGASSTASRIYLPYGLAGIGVLGISGFAAFGLWGYSQKQELEGSCAPFCRSSQVDPVRTKYVVADTCLAVGLVSLGLATYWFVAGRAGAPQASESSMSAAISPTFSGRGGVVDIAARF